MRIFTAILAAHLIFSCTNEPKENRRITTDPAIVTEKKPQEDLTEITEKAEEALKFCVSKKLSTEFCILIDMSLHSGIKRFFVWDFKTKSVVKKYLVGHGCGSNPWSGDGSKDHPEFSNEDGSHLSSLGKYKLQGRGRSEWGINIKYLMHGLEETNSNALKRYIVFHSWDQMSDNEVFPKGSPEGWGCPTISNNAMREIDPMIQKTGKPILMWIYQ
ncbi:peptidase [Chryseobacterium angstadtii]|uniref:Peptidase n=1 Tax=Chryseobacterium angstadtii TaxID=558151 RepID=A0A0J7I182_9FLAO|nr:murein L,D-transpeptidase catalytic domain family protein [Chryseobacterium angstadtii]KMQ60178.1 peptidase [Chryseobacterium angstadtii]